jgi:hydrogenase expression/formation protein HypD
LVANRYTETVTKEGNTKARAITDKYFERGAAVWRGLGAIAGSGYYLRSLYIEFDAGSRSLTKDASLPEGCRCTDVITGRVDPPDCPMFGNSCTPESAHGPCMVSAEGACGIWYANA